MCGSWSTYVPGTKCFAIPRHHAIVPMHNLLRYLWPNCTNFVPKSGAIIGGPPRPPPSSSTAASSHDPLRPWISWYRPSIPLSGPHRPAEAYPSGARLEDVLNAEFIPGTIGTASGLKCSFAALSKGFTALALQSYTTAANLGVLHHLESYLDEYAPGVKDKAEKSITGCPPKAYRVSNSRVQCAL
jgi:hypothetical protein